MPSVEFSAKTLEEARKIAASKLGVTPDQVEFTSTEESKGLFGRTSIKVVATSNAPPVVEEPKAAAAKPRGKVATDDAQADPPAADEPILPGRRGRKPASATALATTDAGTPTEPDAAEVAPESPLQTPRGRARSKPKSEATAAAPAARESNGADASGERDLPEIEATQEHADRYSELLTNLLTESGLEIELKLTELQGRYVNFQIDGKDAAYLIGRSGEVLNALQYLSNLIGKQQFGDGVRVVLDANAFRQQREEFLVNFALKTSKQVLEVQAEALLDPLPAFERRVIHRAISEIPGVKTYSEGEEPNRRIVISPED